MAGRIYNEPTLTYEPNIQYNGVYDSSGNVLGRPLNDRIRMSPVWDRRKPRYIRPRT
jgi:hypothetical protein